ncbi:hypothetical protein [Ruminococcus sp.]|uniref:hypothetical protein n=1 Tax=Ruminococcus sp. TaxID=41978 RepID=UPI0025F4B072|nr:hypothetical protein [Ruminococcus sp.]
MARFSQQEQNKMRREAARRAQEMQQRVHPAMPSGYRQPSPYADYPPEPSESEPIPLQPGRQQNLPPPRRNGMSFRSGLPQLNPMEILSRFDGDSMLILALMAMIYKDGGKEGCDRKLLMALAYLLT